MIVLSTYGDIRLNDLEFVPDFYEYRLDLSEDYFAIPQFFTNIKTILTLRDADEGGLYNGNLSKKIDFLYEKIKIDNFYADIELKYISQIPFECNDKVILSYHDNGYNPLQKLKTILSHIKFNFGFFYKFVFKIDTYFDLIEMHKLLINKGVKYTLISTGKLSVFSRVLYKYLNCYVTYIGMPNKITAHNQISLNDYFKYNMGIIDRNTKITGLLGGKQIFNSIGIEYYNAIFKSKKINKVYIPLFCNELNDFIYLIQSKVIDLQAISITMPFKQIIAVYLNEEIPINYWNIYNNDHYLTDEEAVVKCIDKVIENRITQFILLGSGTMTELFLKHISPYTINLIGRNNTHLEHLRHKYNLKSELNYGDKICLINTTPLGLDNENVLTSFHIDKFDFVIDLPYNKEHTPLIKYCIKNRIAYIDGIQFWYWQAEKQLSLFLEN
jgi:3-dehydroquinate dehydratase type I